MLAESESQLWLFLVWGWCFFAGEGGVRWSVHTLFLNLFF